ncbi:DUF2917 domain-containing protein [bacterium]|nr:DUF2917 domain-containing protein [bacterium]
MKYVISKNEMIFLDGNPTEISILCEDGILWVTQAGDAYDHILKPGEVFRIKDKGKVAITGYRDSSVSLIGKGVILNLVKQRHSTRFTCLRKSKILSILTLLSRLELKDRLKSIADFVKNQPGQNQQLEAY